MIIAFYINYTYTYTYYTYTVLLQVRGSRFWGSILAPTPQEAKGWRGWRIFFTGSRVDGDRRVG